ncbi:3358_t:CDS:2, partial [Gigaspora margarita]
EVSLDQHEDENEINNNQMDRQAIHNELLKYAKSENIEEENIPELSTIQNWLHSYAHIFKQKATDNELE